MKNILVVVGSVRPRRVGRQIADWLIDRAPNKSGLSFEMVDLAQWHLPLGDEPHQPKRERYAGYTQPHTRAWSEKIAAGDGFVFLTPQYNWGYPAALKNALDHLYFEWSGKPALIISYGHRGGAKAAAQLREVLTGLQMTAIESMPAIALAEAELSQDRLLVDPSRALSQYADSITAALDSLSLALLADTAHSGAEV